MSQPITCACGCGESDNPNRMVTSRFRVRDDRGTRPLGKSWMVRKECQAQFEAELGWQVRYGILVKTTAGASFSIRLRMAPECYRLQVGIHQRLKGRKEARRIARGCLWLLLAPREWIGRPVAPVIAA